jgi:hypothetical protein
MFRSACGIALLLAVLAPGRGDCCTIPVFRYAFERWDAGKFDLIVFHRGPLSPADEALVKKVEKHGHLTITTADLNDKLSKDHEAIWKLEENGATLPWLVVRSEEKKPKEPCDWNGVFSADAVKQVVDSPIRQQIVSMFCEGNSAAFVLLLSGDEAKDNAARKLLGKQLPRLEKLIKLSEVSKDGPQLKLPLPLKVALPIIEVTRKQAEEKAFVRMLLSSEEDLDQVQGPIAFPIFGRGRLIGAIYGKYLDNDTILDTVKFLCGDCSCQVKNLNPGTDLLFTADWDGLFERIINTKPATPAVTAPVPKQEEDAKKVIDPVSPVSVSPPAVQETRVSSEVAEPGARRGVLWLGLGGAGVLVVAAGVWVSSLRSKS